MEHIGTEDRQARTGERSSAEPAHRTQDPPEQPWIESTSALRFALSRPWATALIYLLIAVLFASLGWSGLWNVFSLVEVSFSPWYTLVTAVPACALVLLKRRAPAVGLVLALVIFFADLVTVGGLIPLLVVLELMHAHLLTLNAVQRRRALWTLVGLLALSMIAVLLFTSDFRFTAMLALQFGALFSFSYWYANSIAQSQELVRLYRQRSENAKHLAVLDRATAVQGERDRMARELHDVVAGHISAVAIRSEAALAIRDFSGSSEHSAERRALRAVRDSSLDAHAALRSMIRVLRSGVHDFEAPLGRARLPELVAAANESGVRVRLFDEVRSELVTPVDQAVGRIVQEALTNCVRHSSGADVEVRVTDSASELCVDILSFGGGALPTLDLAGTGLGLELLAERVLALNGTFSAGRESIGTQLEISAKEGSKMGTDTVCGARAGASVWAVRARLPVGSTS